MYCFFCSILKDDYLIRLKTHWTEYLLKCWICFYTLTLLSLLCLWINLYKTHLSLNIFALHEDQETIQVYCLLRASLLSRTLR